MAEAYNEAPLANTTHGALSPTTDTEASSATSLSSAGHATDTRRSAPSPLAGCQIRQIASSQA